jgi:hypothetical protein
VLPPHLSLRDRITIELLDFGPDDGRRVGADARTLRDGTPVRGRRWEWDGSQTPDGAYRFRRK